MAAILSSLRGKKYINEYEVINPDAEAIIKQTELK
jgi:hypothetical protein